VTRRDFPEDITGAALVTGAGQRIGSEIARFLASRGIPVALHVNRSREPAEAIAADIIDAGGKAVVMQADLTDRAAWQPLFDAAQEALGPITVLVNNASLFEPDDATDMTHESWARHLAVNLEAPVFLTRALANARSADRTGRRDQHDRPARVAPEPKLFFLYHRQGRALTATQTLAQALAPTVRVAGIGPGPTIQNARQRPEDFQAQIDGLMLKRGAKPEDITRAVGFILDSPAFTGQMLAIDGGQHLAWETPDIAGIPE
jgi:NAD(P)-dependent dehydrogenase (short-subunit alcohol dehydrogenase family)